MNIKFDWSFALPTLSLISICLPILISIKDWFQSRLDDLEKRINTLEPFVILLRDNTEESRQQNQEINRYLLRLESKIELTKNTINDLKIDENLKINQRLLKSLLRRECNEEDTES
ncbi:MAG: hypothetical protein U7123_07265 [Potamolinea sp.]